VEDPGDAECRNDECVEAAPRQAVEACRDIGLDDGGGVRHAGMTLATAKGFATMMRLLPLIAFLCLSSAASQADEVGRFSNDWTGNGIVVEAVADPKVDGVSCHLVHFDRSVIDRLAKGNWFENPSNSGISCQQTGPIVIGKIATSA